MSNRLLESGDVRLLESGDARLLEVDSAAELTGEIVDLSDMTTVLATLDRHKALEFNEVINDVGVATITFFNDDPALAAISGANTLVNIYVQGTLAVTALFKSWTAARVKRKAIEEVTVWQGPLHHALLDRVLVYPTLALGSWPIEEDRGFNFYANIFDPGPYTVVPATAICSVNDAQTGSWPVVPFDPDFAATTADVLGPSSGSTSTAPTGTWFVEQVVVIPFFGTWEIQLVADNYADVYFDGAHIASPGLGNGFTGWTAEGFTKMTTVRMVLSAGIHSLRAGVTNIANPPANDIDPTGFAFGVLVVYPNGTLGPIISQSDATYATVIEYPSEIPGMTVGAILLELWGEGKQGTTLGFFAGTDRAYGDALAAVNLFNPTFDAVNDTNGDPWPILTNYSTKIGSSLLMVCSELAAAGYLDFSFTPGTLDWNAWIGGGRGSASGVDFHAQTNPDDPTTGNLEDHDEHGETVITNSLLIRTDIGWYERESALNIAAAGRIEAPLSLGANTGEAERTRLSDATLGEFGDERIETTIGIKPVDATDTPYLAFGVGDTLTVEGVSHRVLGLTVTEDDIGRAVFTPTLNDDVVLSWEERIGWWFRKMVLYTLGGRSKLAQPYVPHWLPRGLPAPGPGADPIGTWEFFSSDGGALSEMGMMAECLGTDGLRYLASSIYIGFYTALFASYDFGTDTWTALSDPTIGEVGLVEAMGSYGGKVVVLYRHTAGGSEHRTRIYTIAGATWAAGAVSTIPTTDLINAYCHDGQYIYVLSDDGFAASQLSRYDINGDSWTYLTDAPDRITPSAQENHRGAVLDGNIYWATGSGSDTSGGLYEYDISGDSWTQLANDPTGGGDGAVVGPTTRGNLFVSGRTVPELWVPPAAFVLCAGLRDPIGNDYYGGDTWFDAATFEHGGEIYTVIVNQTTGNMDLWHFVSPYT